MMHHKELYSIFQIRLLEKLAIDQGIDEFELMKAAGKAAFDYLMLNWPQADKIDVMCGAGNNAGDGFLVAYYAKKMGRQVTLYHLGNLEKATSSTTKAMALCQDSNIPILPFDAVAIKRADVLVDALLGIGIKEDVRPRYREVIDAINVRNAIVLSIDVPSGLDADTGTVLGCAIKATKTVTFIGLKQGLLTNDGPDHCGEIHLATLDVPEDCYAKVPASGHLLQPELIKKIPYRQKNSQKGNFGHVLVIGGDAGMAGAVRLTAQAALRVGAGLVSVATHPDNAAIVCAHYPEIMCHEIGQAAELPSLLERATVLVVGPGLGQKAWGRSLLEAALQSSLPMIIDADGLNLLGQKPTCRDNWILTPHPGEAARLLGFDSAKEVQRNRFTAITSLSQLGGVWLLKGAGTLTKAQASSIALCPYGNPGMASGGMGDALSGVIAGLVAQKLPLLKAIDMGVLIHALAGDVAARAGEVGLVASDLIEQIRGVIASY